MGSFFEVYPPTHACLFSFLLIRLTRRHKQFLLAFVSWEDVVKADGWEKQLSLCMMNGQNFCPGWYLLKQYVESRAPFTAAAPTAGGSSLEASAAWMHQYLRPVEDLLKHQYAAVGILEEFDTTLALFNVTLDIPGLNWPTAFQNIGRWNRDEVFAQEEAETLLRGEVDPDIQDTLWLDVLLYDYAVGVFHAQAKEHGLL